MAEEQQVNLTHVAHRINTAMAHDLTVRVRLTTGHVVVGKVTRKRIDPNRKIDTKAKNTSNLVVTIGGQDVLVEDMRSVEFGS